MEWDATPHRPGTRRRPRWPGRGRTAGRERRDREGRSEAAGVAMGTGERGTVERESIDYIGSRVLLYLLFGPTGGPWPVPDSNYTRTLENLLFHARQQKRTPRAIRRFRPRQRKSPPTKQKKSASSHHRNGGSHGYRAVWHGIAYFCLPEFFSSLTHGMFAMLPGATCYSR